MLRATATVKPKANRGGGGQRFLVVLFDQDVDVQPAPADSPTD